MATAGYDPRAALDLWDLMAAVEADAAASGTPVSIEDSLSFLHTHPTSQVRQQVSLVRQPAGDSDADDWLGRLLRSTCQVR